ncbi:hypothetical protein GSS88_03065 [Corynebacterium sp. 3HC-13]|uniref:hypothetical protein n=1 Tax=Corynebacterium poyangense TaxID=2684405 RepID=UPI001CCBD1BF|nr:hypothetical protein [Corynebacterium poyangense]MBZ8176781.1 hypothetical protein [Corynebacterium poyangense]
MTKHRREGASWHRSHRPDPVAADDAFLTALSKGKDPSHGKDELAALLLELRAETHAPMPEVPGVGGDTAPEGSAEIIDFTARRRRGWLNHVSSALVGAAAATLLIAGSGALLYNVQPGSPLWGLSSKIFEDRAAVVELSGTLDDIDAAVDAGSSPTVLRELVAKARGSLERKDQNRQSVDPVSEPNRNAPVTVTVTAPAPPAGDPMTVTETVTRTTTQVVTPTKEPTPASSSTTSTSESNREAPLPEAAQNSSTGSPH